MDEETRMKFDHVHKPIEQDEYDSQSDIWC